MPESPQVAPGTSRSSLRRSLWIVAGALAVLALVFGLLVSGGGEDPSPQSTTTTAAPTPPPFAPAPYAVTDRTELTVPEETRFAEGTFWAEAGAQYVVTMDLQSTKPEGSGGRSMYLGVTLGCSPQAGGPGVSAGGTQNMLTGEEAAYRNQGLISVPEDGGVDCSIKLSAPYDHVASNDTTFPVEATWEVRKVDAATEAAKDEVLPTTIAADATEDVLTADLPVDEATGELRSLSSLHLTTCTVVNGSREDGRAWCSEKDLDEKGSTVTLEARVELVDDDGAVCAELGTEEIPADRIDLYRHHRLLSLAVNAVVPEEPCGRTARGTVSVHTDGPAPVVVHRSNSTLLIAG